MLYESVIADLWIEELNSKLLMLGSKVRIRKNKRVIGTFDIVIEDAFVESCILNFNNDFYEYLKNFFKNKGVENIIFNNSGSAFWANYV